VPVGSEETSGLWWYSPDESRVAPVASAPFYKLSFADIGESLAYWIPGAGVVRTAPQGGGAVWIRPRPEESVLLIDSAATLRPFAAPTRASVTVGYRDVPRGASAYLRLFTMGKPVSHENGARGWIRIYVWTGDTPWT
jgi:hypothetical protein